MASAIVPPVQKSERNREDREFCSGLMTQVLHVGYTEGDIVKIQRLGKRTDRSKVRPLLVKFSDDKIKNLVMEFATRLSQAK